MTIAVLGEALIDLIMEADGAYRPHRGGSPYNVAIGLARQGVAVSYLASLSDDHFGEDLRASLLREGVSVPVQRRSRWPTSLALVTVNKHGQPSYSLYREGIADKDTSLEEILEHLPADLQVFHTGSLAITPSQLPKITTLLAELRRRGVCISIDINIRLRASLDTDRYLAGVRSLLPYADFVKASDEDVDAFGLDADPRRAARQLYSVQGGGLLIYTEGSGGTLLFGAPGQDQPMEVGAYRVPVVADTIGAGDTFHSAFRAFLYARHAFGGRAFDKDAATLLEALDYACAAAAINVSRAGCSPPTRNEVLKLQASGARTVG